ncbi:hypothetical protein GCM10010423_00950 [Streptomyces levis]|uniref:Uncharacterized protein n=1 Tax=Streptomyces levis TaxID=285566 RepID=A0ABN3N420_9ACTN
MHSEGTLGAGACLDNPPAVTRSPSDRAFSQLGPEFPVVAPAMETAFPRPGSGASPTPDRLPAGVPGGPPVPSVLSHHAPGPARPRPAARLPGRPRGIGDRKDTHPCHPAFREPRDEPPSP